MLLPSDKLPSSLFAFKIYLHHLSVTSFLSGVPPLPQKVQGPVVRRPISANPGLNFNLRFFIPSLKSLFGKIFSVLFKASSSHTLNKKNSTEDLKSDFTLTLGYLNPALNNPAQNSFLR